MNSKIHPTPTLATGSRPALNSANARPSNRPAASTSQSDMARKRKPDSPPSEPASKMLRLVYLDKDVHRAISQDVHFDFLGKQAFREFARLPTHNTFFPPALLYEFLRNYNGAKRATQVGGRKVGLGEEVLSRIFWVPKGK